MLYFIFFCVARWWTKPVTNETEIAVFLCAPLATFLSQLVLNFCLLFDPRLSSSLKNLDFSGTPLSARDAWIQNRRLGCVGSECVPRRNSWRMPSCGVTSHVHIGALQNLPQEALRYWQFLWLRGPRKKGTGSRESKTQVGKHFLHLENKRNLHMHPFVAPESRIGIGVTGNREVKKKQQKETKTRKKKKEGNARQRNQNFLRQKKKTFFKDFQNNFTTIFGDGCKGQIQPFSLSSKRNY